MSLPLLTVFTDASFCHKTKAGGWAVWAKREDMPTFFQSGSFKQKMPGSMECEAAAVSIGCFLLMKHGYLGGDHHVLIKTDCQSVIDDVGRFAHKIGRLANFTEDLRKAKRAVRCLELRHVKGHLRNDAGARHAVNNRCDRAAREAMERARKELI